MPPPNRSRSRLARIKLLYAFAFGVIALTLALASAVMHISIRQNVDDARVINLAGRQRMLSQRITKCALALAAAESPGSADPRAEELRLALAQWSQAHQGLQQGDPSLGLPAGSRSPAIQALFREMDGPHDAMLQAGGHLLASLGSPTGDPARRSAAVRQDARALLDQEGTFLALMDRATFTFDREARAKVERLQRLETAVLLIGLMVLALEFFLVFRPSIGQLEVAISTLLRQEEQLLAANQSLTIAERDLLQAQRAGRVATFRWDAVADHWSGSDLLVELLGLAPDGPRTFLAWAERLPPGRQAEFQQRFRDFLASGATLDLACPVLDPATGTERWLNIQGELERDAQGQPLLLSGTVQDITEHRRAEEENRQIQSQLHLNQRLESLGSLAGGIAHDMNNVLAAVQAITEALRQSRSGDADLLRSLDALDTASVRGRGLVRGLTQFVRKELKEIEVLDLNRLVRDEADLLRRTTRQKVALVLDLETSLAPVLGERSTLATALMNICINAVDAMPGGGILTLHTRSGEGGTVELEVTDTGAGMRPEVAERAMEPFFTTKPRGQGTGLGLATVHAAAVNHGGQAWLRSEPGKGTSVFLRFPACAGRPAPASGPGQPLQDGRPLELLLVDDDDLVRDSLAALLASLGHRVREATGGEEALSAIATGLQPDLVILDYNMPGMDGLETLRRMRHSRPRLPVLLATGFLEPAVQRALHTDPHALGISKPFTARELVRRMSEVMGA